MRKHNSKQKHFVQHINEEVLAAVGAAASASVRGGGGCPTPGTAQSSQFTPGPQGPTMGYGRSHQQHWWHLWENVLKKGQKMLDRERRKE